MQEVVTEVIWKERQCMMPVLAEEAIKPGEDWAVMFPVLLTVVMPTMVKVPTNKADTVTMGLEVGEVTMEVEEEHLQVVEAALVM
jgi:hypothetical protein